MPGLILTSCRVCGRKLTNLRSIQVSMGPVCVKRFGILFDEAQSYATSIGRQLDVGVLQMYATTVAQAAYNQRIGRVRRGEPAPASIPQDQVVETFSATRGRAENVTVQFSDADHGIVASPSGQQYEVTRNSCTCGDYIYRLRGTGGECRHIQAFNTARGRVQAQNQAQDQARQTLQQSQQADSRSAIRAMVDRSVHQQAVRTFRNTNWVEEEAREGVLQVWRENRSFDGIYMSEDDEAWTNLQRRAEADWDYQYENVLGGTGNSFGIEIEFELPRNVSQQRVAQALYEEGILDRADIFGYHTGERRVGPGFWRLETDSSLSNGLELVSPVLYDTRETWEKLERATKKLKELGAKVSNRTGGHVHIGIGPLDHRTYSWQRLGRIGVAYEKLFYRMGGADADGYERNRRVGRHRGTDYAKPLASNQSIRAGDTAAEARRTLSSSRRVIFNATNVDNTYSAKPTVEMRYPNGTLNHKQWQAQVQLANSVVHQAAVIRNESPQSRFTPRFSQHDEHLRHGDSCTNEMEQDQFRRFLDVLGNPNDRLAATWLYKRGSV